MSLAGINDLKLAGVLRNLAQAIEVGKNQVRALVARGAPSKANRKHFWVQMETGLLADFFEQFVPSDKMCRPDIFRRQAQCAAQTKIVLAPGRNITVKELLERGASPCSRMNTIRDGMDRHFGKHLARSLAMLLGYSIDVGAQIQCQLRHVHRSPAARRVQQARNILLRLQDSLHKIRRRSVAQIKEVDLFRE